MKKLLCKIGIHKWEYINAYMTESGRTIVSQSKCKCCGYIKEKIKNMY